MTNKVAMWMVRAGEGGFRFEDFKVQNRVSIGWAEMGDMQRMPEREDFLRAATEVYPNSTRGQLGAWAGQPYRFVREMQVGDSVLTYAPAERSYLVGTVKSGYQFRPRDDEEMPNLREVGWRGQVARDRRSVGARNSLGAIATLFLVPPEVAAEVEQCLAHPDETLPADAPLAPPAAVTVAEAGAQVDDLYKDIQGKGIEFIKDQVSALHWADMQELVAGLLRAMGYKTRVSPSGSDRGKDIVASRDGLGFEDPRIVVEVKHRQEATGSQDIRSFLGGRHNNDKGLYVSTGGFTKDARYEAERARIPLTLMDLDDLVKSILEHYEALDMSVQRLVPLRKLYWPVW